MSPSLGDSGTETPPPSAPSCWPPGYLPGLFLHPVPRFARRYQPWLDKTARDNRRQEEAARRGKSGPVFLPSRGLTTKTHAFPEPLFYSQSLDIRPPREIRVRMLTDWQGKMDKKMKKITRKGGVRGRGSGRLGGRNKGRVKSRGRGGGRGRGRGRDRLMEVKSLGVVRVIDWPTVVDLAVMMSRVRRRHGVMRRPMRSRVPRSRRAAASPPPMRKAAMISRSLPARGVRRCESSSKRTLLFSPLGLVTTTPHRPGLWGVVVFTHTSGSAVYVNQDTRRPWRYAGCHRLPRPC